MGILLVQLPFVGSRQQDSSIGFGTQSLLFLKSGKLSDTPPH